MGGKLKSKGSASAVGRTGIDSAASSQRAQGLAQPSATPEIILVQDSPSRDISGPQRVNTGYEPSEASGPSASD